MTRKDCFLFFVLFAFNILWGLDFQIFIFSSVDIHKYHQLLFELTFLSRIYRRVAPLIPPTATSIALPHSPIMKTILYICSISQIVIHLVIIDAIDAWYYIDCQ